MMKKLHNNTLLQKPKLCKLINTKFRDIKQYGKNITDEDRINAYTKNGKNIFNCKKSDSKGGYTLIELKELAINYYYLTEANVNNMSKEELCNHISSTIQKLKETKKTYDANIEQPLDNIKESIPKSNQQNIQETQNIQDKEYSMIYPHDINLCKLAPNRGGIGNKALKKIAHNNFGINIEHKHKDILCNEISQKLKNNIHKHLIQRKDTLLDTKQIQKSIDNTDNTDNTEKQLIYNKHRRSKKSNIIYNDKIDDELDDNNVTNIDENKTYDTFDLDELDNLYEDDTFNDITNITDITYTDSDDILKKNSKLNKSNAINNHILVKKTNKKNKKQKTKHKTQTQSTQRTQINTKNTNKHKEHT